jgi:multidrug resistance efflux pump
MSDLTPDTLAALAYRLECNGEAAAAIVCLHHASSWRANLAFANEDNTSMNSRLVDAEARIEAANKTWVGMWQEEHDQCIEALARIEALEKKHRGFRAEIETYRVVLAAIRDGVPDAQESARNGLHFGEEAALRSEEER